MAREYTLADAGITVANAAVTLAFLNPKAGTVVEIIRAWIGQSANATSAQQRCQLNTQVTAFPTLVSKTPAKLKTGDPLSGIVGGTAGAAGTSGINASAEGAGGKTVIWPDAFNVLNGWLWVPTPKEVVGVQAAASAGFGLHLPVAPATLTNWAFGIVFAEVG